MRLLALVRRICFRMNRTFIIIGLWTLLMMTFHLLLVHQDDVCNCQLEAEGSSTLPRQSNHLYNNKTANNYHVEKSKPDVQNVMVAGEKRTNAQAGRFSHRLPKLDPLRWRVDPVENENEPKFTTEDIEYGVNVIPSLHKSIEGDLWHPLSDYKTTCWVEKLHPDVRLLRNPPVVHRARVMGLQRVRERERQQPEATGPPSKIDKYALDSVGPRARAEDEFQQEIYNRVQNKFYWKMRCLPYAYFIGVTKSGTSDFYRYLNIHQDIVEPKTKEIHYWNELKYPRPALLYGKERKHKMTFDNYLDFFEIASHQINNSVIRYDNETTWHPKVIVDGSVSMFWEDNGWTQIPGNRGLKSPRYTTARTLAHFQPKAKIILLLREPVDRVYSYFRMFARGFMTENPEIFHNMTLGVLRLYEECLHIYNVRECAYSTEIEKASYTINIRSSLYSAFMPDWLRVFPTNQIHVIRSEDYYANRKTVLKETVQFLDLDPFTPELIDILGDNTNKIVRKNSQHLPMLNSTRKLLQTFFQPYNDELGHMLGRTFWDYDTQ